MNVLSTPPTPSGRAPSDAANGVLPTATARLAVGPQHLAAAHGEDPGETYPPVFSTPSLIALLERACAAALRPRLAAGESSVGVRVQVTHLVPTALGETVHAHARFLRMEGRLFVFEVEASDAAGSIARGEHARAIVKTLSVETKARERAGHARAAA